MDTQPRSTAPIQYHSNQGSTLNTVDYSSIGSPKHWAQPATASHSQATAPIQFRKSSDPAPAQVNSETEAMCDTDAQPMLNPVWEISRH
jgi:hypothetical protein